MNSEVSSANNNTSAVNSEEQYKNTKSLSSDAWCATGLDAVLSGGYNGYEGGQPG